MDALEVGRLKRRLPEAVERWFLSHANLVYTFVFYRVGRDEELAEEVVQETFLRALQEIDRYDPQRGSMGTWLCFVARNRIRKALRERGRYREVGVPWERIDRRLLEAYQGLDAAPLADETLERDETADLVRMTLANLPEKYREALRLHYCERRSLEQIAALNGSTAGAVKSLLHRARLAFKAAFETLADSLHRPPASRRAER
jgi:RNA polymerase sigma-70 factor (ECF subfamily)